MFSGADVRRAVEREIERLGKSRKARVVRERAEFDPSELRRYVASPFVPPAAYSWSIEDIVSARDQQMVGRFRLPARLAESMGTNPAIFTARNVRLAPVQGLDVTITSAGAGKADTIAAEAEALFGPKGIAISSETMTTIRKHLADHGVAFAVINRTVRADGSRIDYMLSAWPIEFVWWHPVAQRYYTQARFFDDTPDDPAMRAPTMPTGIVEPMVPIIHGDGRWVVFAKSEILPHRDDAAILPGALVWATGAFADRDWSKGSATHGNAKVVGELPEGTALSDEEGNLTTEAAAMLQLVSAVASQDQPVGIRPAGSKIDYITNPSRAWEVWKELSLKSEKAAARIYLGTDGVLGAAGGAPGVDISELFGVATSKIQSDLACIEKGLQTGVISPWCAENFGDDKLAPVRKYQFPDPDQSRVREDFAKRNAAFLADVKAARDAGLQPTPDWCARVAEAHGVPCPPLVADAPAPTAPTAQESP